MLQTTVAVVARDNAKNIIEVSEVIGETLVDVPHHLIFYQELHELPLLIHSSVADVNLPEVSGKVGLVVEPGVAGNSEGVGPTEARRGSRWRGGRRGGG